MMQSFLGITHEALLLPPPREVLLLGVREARRDLIGAPRYLVGRDAQTGAYYTDTTPCAMCRRLIINAGITQVVSRTGEDEYTTTLVRDWVYNDDTLH